MRRRSRASTFQITSARLSKNGTMVTFALDTSLLRHTREKDGSEGVAALGSGFFWHDRYSHARNCTAFLSNTGLFLSNWNKNLFLLQRLLVPFDS